MNKFVKWAVVAAGVLFALFVLATFAIMAFVFSIGTAIVDLQVDATVLDRRTEQPVADCLLAFEKGFDGGAGYGRTTVRSDRNGQSSHASTHSYGGSMFWPFDRDRHPTVRFYVGEPPHYGSDAKVESWELTFHFQEPWSSKEEVTPRIEVRRSLAHDESYVYKEGDPVREGVGSDPIPANEGHGSAKATIRFERDAEGRSVYRILLSVLLDRSQIEACQAASIAQR